MTIKPAVRTMQEIEKLTRRLGGTWVRRRNARKKMIAWSNEIVDEAIHAKKKEIRQLKAEGMKERDLREHYAEVTRLETQKI